uniref:von Hippel-Lindau disease tumour suppressor beta domain-containing protein n=1 Tax=Glossina brevipalpis TaxID=37001 RepID=A0A1A9W2G6_9MUSC
MALDLIRLRPAPQLAAQYSIEKSFVFFENSTTRSVNLYWMDFNGFQQLFQTLKPGAGIKINTYVKHPWIFRDRVTGERMHVKNKDVFWPQVSRIRNAVNASWMSYRKLVAIHLPIRSLRSKCLWAYAEQVFENHKTTLDNLIIPQTLKADLKHILDMIEKHQKLTSASYITQNG